MFSGAYVFNVDIGSWDVSNVTDMSYMFNQCSLNEETTGTFNQDLSSWEVSGVLDCFNFSICNPDWNLQYLIVNQPNFTNCTP